MNERIRQIRDRMNEINHFLNSDLMPEERHKYKKEWNELIKELKKLKEQENK